MSEAAGITVTGNGRMAVRPDVLVVRLGAEATTGSVQGALDRSSKAMSAMTSAFRDAGVAETDLTTTGASVDTAYDGDGNAKGWRANQTLTARLHDLSAAGGLISAAASAAGDAARLHDVTFSVENSQPAREEARRRAFADAAAKATVFAELAERELGRVRSIREVDVRGGIVPMRAVASSGEGGAGSAVPLEQGSFDISAAVEVTWDFLP